MNLYCEELGGSRNRKPTSKFVVTRWYIPGGYMYDQARNIDIFFDVEENAAQYAKENEMPPEMATMWPIAVHDDLVAKSCKGYYEYKKRFWSDFANDDRPKEFQRED